MSKEQVKKNPRGASMTPKQDDSTPKSLELSEGQLEVHFRVSTWRTRAGSTRRLPFGRKKKVGRIETSWLCYWLKK